MKLDLGRPIEHGGAVWYSIAASTRFPEHHHEELELNLVLRGSAAYRVGGESLPLAPGTLIALPPGIRHQIEGVSAEFSAWVIKMSAGFVTEAGQGQLLSSGVQRATVDRASVTRLSKECAPLLLPSAKGAMAGALERIVDMAAPCFAARETMPEPLVLHPTVEHAAELLSDCGDLPLATIARRVGLSTSRLTHVFSEQLGLPPVQYRNHLRVQRFIARFGRGEGENMLETALASGFGSYPQFHRVFHQVTGHSPAEHLRRVRAGIVDPVPQGPVGSANTTQDDS